MKQLADWIKSLSPSTLEGCTVKDKIPFAVKFTENNSVIETCYDIYIKNIQSDGVVIGNRKWHVVVDLNGKCIWDDEQHILWDKPI